MSLKANCIAFAVELQRLHNMTLNLQANRKALVKLNCLCSLTAKMMQN